jgi:hypothetical protein
MLSSPYIKEITEVVYMLLEEEDVYKHIKSNKNRSYTF